ncbi:MAG TPA: hypothetical protein PLN33_06010 [Hyphomonadaceae bacterium]|nr:hypothetical protein [Hyphomonadaceae bacterium]HPN04319.1 hypothetical protein [Hyphomonadaceae bacterium]
MSRAHKKTSPVPAGKAKPARRKMDDHLTETLEAPAEAHPSPAPEAGASASPVKLLPASIPFRAFKVALLNMKELGAIPERIDRSVWTSQLFGLDLHGMINAYRFLQLIDGDDRPTDLYRDLLESIETDAWPIQLRRVLETAYAPLLASSMSSLTAGGLLHMFRRIYRTPSEATRKCCSFFVHAGREAALDIGPFLLTTSRSRWVEGRRIDRRDTGDNEAAASKSPENNRDQALSDLVAKFPAYDAKWPDDVKRLWFSAFNDLLQKFDD